MTTNTDDTGRPDDSRGAVASLRCPADGNRTWWVGAIDWDRYVERPVVRATCGECGARVTAADLSRAA